MIVRSKQLMREAWGPDRTGDTRSLRVCLKNLREKLEPDPRGRSTSSRRQGSAIGWFYLTSSRDSKGL